MDIIKLHQIWTEAPLANQCWLQMMSQGGSSPAWLIFELREVSLVVQDFCESSFLILVPCIVKHAALAYSDFGYCVIHAHVLHNEHLKPHCKDQGAWTGPGVYRSVSHTVFTGHVLCLPVLSQQRWLNSSWFRRKTSCRFPLYRQRWSEAKKHPGPGDSLLHLLLTCSHSNTKLTFMRLFHWYILYTHIFTRICKRPLFFFLEWNRCFWSDD